jgi:hypothetical protein
MPTTSSDLNAKLRSLYGQALPRLRTLVASEETLSNPHFISVPESYTTIPTRILVVGQQTNGWGDRNLCGRSNALDALMTLYANFNLGETYTASPFWQATVLLNRLVNPASPPRSFLWSNLVKLDQSGNRPIEELENQICQLGLLQKEIDITNPDVVVFFTGPDYDQRLKQSFPDSVWEKMSRFIVSLKHPNLPALAFRTYHPNYLRRSGNWKVIQKVGQAIMSHTHGS